jgi:polyhydroxyalkanoate synthesis regulator phasin
MKTIQYTIRNVPIELDRYLRHLSEATGTSLNKVIIEELSTKARRIEEKQSLLESLDWFIGSNTIDDEVLKVLEDEDVVQKQLMHREWQKMDELAKELDSLPENSHGA